MQLWLPPIKAWVDRQAILYLGGRTAYTPSMLLPAYCMRTRCGTSYAPTLVLPRRCGTEIGYGASSTGLRTSLSL
eukprot:2924106-Rhodomonas_salina.1